MKLTPMCEPGKKPRYVRPLRPLKEGEVRRWYFGYGARIIKPGKYGDRKAYLAAIDKAVVRRFRKEARESEAILPKLVEAVFSNITTTAVFPRVTPSLKMTAMYLAHTSLGWTHSRCGRAIGKNPTTIGYWIRKIEDARDDDAFDAEMTKIETALAGGN